MRLVESPIFIATMGVKKGREELLQSCRLLCLLASLGLFLGCASAPEASSQDSIQWDQLSYPSIEMAFVNAPNQAIQAPKEIWTWVPFADSMCADGSPSGVMVNLNPDSDKVMIHLQGGGACVDWESCQRTDPPDAINLHGFDRNDTASHFPIGYCE
jgi:hypothetical protein